MASVHFGALYKVEWSPKKVMGELSKRDLERLVRDASRQIEKRQPGLKEHPELLVGFDNDFAIIATGKEDNQAVADELAKLQKSNPQGLMQHAMDLYTSFSRTESQWGLVKNGKGTMDWLVAAAMSLASKSIAKEKPVIPIKVNLGKSQKTGTDIYG